MDYKMINAKLIAYRKGREFGEKQIAKDIFQLFYDIAKTEVDKTINLDVDLIKEIAKVYEVEVGEANDR